MTVNVTRKHKAYDLESQYFGEIKGKTRTEESEKEEDRVEERVGQLKVRWQLSCQTNRYLVRSDQWSRRSEYTLSTASYEELSLFINRWRERIIHC